MIVVDPELAGTTGGDDDGGGSISFDEIESREGFFSHR